MQFMRSYALLVSRRESIANIEIPDVGNLARHIEGTGDLAGQDVAEVIRELGRLAHDLRRALQHAGEVMQMAMDNSEFGEIYLFIKEVEAL